MGTDSSHRLLRRCVAIYTVDRGWTRLRLGRTRLGSNNDRMPCGSLRSPQAFGSSKYIDCKN